MRKTTRGLLLGLLVSIFLVAPVLASYTANILVKETSGIAYPMLACNVSANVDHLVTYGYINADALDTRVEAGSTELPHILASGNASVGRIQFALPVGSNTAETVDFTTGSSNLTYFPVIPGYDGYVTVEDAANIRVTDNFTAMADGWFNTTPAASKNIMSKPSTFEMYVDDTAANVSCSLAGFGAFNFTGTPDKLERADNATLSALTPLTVELWIKTTDATSALQGLINKDAAGNHEWALALNNGLPRLIMYIWDDSANAYIARFDSAVNVNDGDWHYIFASWNGSAVATGIELWVDNAQVDDTSATQGVFVNIDDKAAPLQIGTYQTDAGYFIGDIDEVRVSDKVRSAAERTAYYNAGAGACTVDDANTIVLYHCDDDGGGTTTDSSSNGLDATITGATLTTGHVVCSADVTTALASGEYCIECSANTTHFWIEVDGVVKDTTSIVIAPPSTSGNWTMYQNNSLIYSDNLSIVIDGTLELWYRPTSIIQSVDASTGNLTDLTNVYNHGIITWGSNPTGVAMTVGGLVSSWAGAGEVDPLAQPDILPVITTPVTAADAAILVTLAGDPLFPLATAINTVTSISIVLIYQFALLLLAFVVFIATYKLYPHLFLCGVLFCVPIGYGVSLTVFSFGMIAIIVIVLIASAVMEGRQPG